MGMGEEMSGSAIGSNFYDFKHAYLSNVPLTANSVSSLTGKPNGEGSIASFFGRVNYNYQEKYMASVIMRADGSSTLPADTAGDTSLQYPQDGLSATSPSCQESNGWTS